MGVFARIFRRSKATEETRTDEARDGRTAAGPQTEDAAGTAQSKASAETPETDGPTVQEADGVTGTDGVEIPKQQSSEAVGSEADKGART